MISRRPPLASDKIRKLKNLQFIVTEDVEATNELLDAPVTYNRVSASRARYLAKKHGGSGHSVEQRLLVPFDAAHLSLIERPLPRVVGVIVDDIRQTEEAVEFAKKYRSTHPQHVFRLVLPIEAYEDEDSWMRYYSEEEDELLDVIFALHERSLY